MVNVIYRTFIDHVYTIPCPHTLILLALIQSNLYCPSLFSIWILCLNLDFQVCKKELLIYSHQKKGIAVIKYPKNGKMRKKVFVWFTMPGYSLSLQESQGIKHLRSIALVIFTVISQEQWMTDQLDQTRAQETIHPHARWAFPPQQTQVRNPSQACSRTHLFQTILH